MNTTTPSRRARFGWYVMGVCVASALVCGLSFRLAPLPASWLVPLMVIAAVLSEMLAFELPNGNSTSLGLAIGVATAVLLGPSAACLVAAASSLDSRDLRRQRPWLNRAFNLGQLTLVTVLAAWVYLAAGGTVLISGGQARPVTPSGVPHFLVAASLCLGTLVICNDLLVSVGFRIVNGVSIRAQWESDVRWMLPTQLALGAMGLIIAQVLAVTPVALPLFAFPLIIAQQTYRWYLGYREAYADTIKALVGLIEAKDPYTRGHSERVAAYAVEIGQVIGLNSRALERLEYAALLHDFGKVRVPAAVLGKAGSLTDAEMEVVRMHPRGGADLVAEIPYLRDLSDTIAHHHERYDGGGYASGLQRDSIPLSARVLAVADSYDAMTSDRPYRTGLDKGTALEELERQAGKQFDPDVVAAFMRIHSNGGIA